MDYAQMNREEWPFAVRLAQWIRSFFNPKAVLDVGCGPGMYVYALRSVGVAAVGFDTDTRVEGKEHLSRKSVADNDQHAEMVLCLEVMEHIPRETEDAAMDGLVRAVEPGGVLIFTAARPGQSGDGHVNCKPREAWRAMLLGRGLIESEYVRKQLIEYILKGYHMGWFVNNLIVLTKPGDVDGKFSRHG